MPLGLADFRVMLWVTERTGPDAGQRRRRRCKDHGADAEVSPIKARCSPISPDMMAEVPDMGWRGYALVPNRLASQWLIPRCVELGNANRLRQPRASPGSGRGIRNGV